MEETIRKLTRPDTSVDDRYLNEVSERERENERQRKEKRREERRRRKILQGIFQGVRNTKTAKTINVYNLEGKYEGTYMGYTNAAKALGVKYQTVQRQLKRGGTVKGKQIRETEISWINGKPCVNKRNTEPARKRGNPNPKQPVSVYDLDGDYLETYGSIRECAEKLGVDGGTISRVLKNAGRGEGDQQAGGYMFRKAKKLEEWCTEKWDKRRIRPYTGKKRRKYTYKEYKTKA